MVQPIIDITDPPVPDDETETCDDCGATVQFIIGCPDGAEICQACFDAGHH